MLDTETNQQQVPDLITEKDMDKYFVQPDEQEDKDETKTISSTLTADYNREDQSITGPIAGERPHSRALSVMGTDESRPPTCCNKTHFWLHGTNGTCTSHI